MYLADVRIWDRSFMNDDGMDACGYGYGCGYRYADMEILAVVHIHTVYAVRMGIYRYGPARNSYF